MITFNSDFVLKQVIESVYDYVDQIIIVDGCVKYWTDKGFTGSTDDTHTILQNLPDPYNKFTFILGATANEKTELCRKFMPFIKPDTTHLWCMDSDEVFKPKDIAKIKEVLSERDPHSIGFKSNTFFGGFSHIMGKFEQEHTFKRILKYEHGCTYVDHRPPTLSTERVPKALHISGKEMSEGYGVEMYHYSYVSARQVKEKIDYYESAVIRKGQCIPNYYNDVFLNWVRFPESRPDIEKKWKGVQEFVPEARGECYTVPFTGEHPEVIKRDMDLLMDKFNRQLNDVQ